MEATKEVLKRALELACERIADGPQEYHEAATPDQWMDRYVLQATGEQNPATA